MEDIYKIAANGGISDAELKDALKASLTGRTLKKVLIIPPDFTRFHSQAGRITSIYYHLLTERGAQVSEKHAGFVINRGGASCTNVTALMAEIQKRVREQTGVVLEPEVRVIT